MTSEIQRKIHTVSRFLFLAMVSLILCGCPPSPDDTPEPPPPPPPDPSVDRGVMPIIEFQVNNTATTSDDYIGDEPMPCRLRVVNQIDFVTDVQVSLENVSTGQGRMMVFSYAISSSQSGFLTLLIPANGEWAEFYIRPFNNIQSRRDKDAIVQMNLRRANPAGGPRAGTVIGRKAMMITNSPPNFVNANTNFANANIELQINNNASSVDDYLTWSPMPCRIRQVGGDTPVTVNLRNIANSTGRILFAEGAMLAPHTTTATRPTLNNVTLPANENWVDFYIAGQFGRPSVDDKDAIIEITNTDNQLIAREALMVRIRKNANTITPIERDRFINALITLNQTLDMYEVFNEIHAIGIQEAHFGPAFSPWHRAFVLDLERQLQIIDPSVTVPYWRFDEPAPNVFDADFMGGFSGTSSPSFTSTNPLALWRVENMTGISRMPLFAPNQAPDIISEFATIAVSNQYDAFNSALESGPHNRAHALSSGPAGWIGTIPTAVRDPLFFLLHSNVDRLWAKWQWANIQLNPSSVSSYSPQGTFPGEEIADFHIGHYGSDTMWPWNEVTGTGSTSTGDRPFDAPGGALEPVFGAEESPPLSPTPRDMVDYQSIRSINRVNPGMGFAYDDVPYD